MNIYIYKYLYIFIYHISKKKLEQAQCLLYLHPCWKCIFVCGVHILCRMFGHLFFMHNFWCNVTTPCQEQCVIRLWLLCTCFAFRLVVAVRFRGSAAKTQGNMTLANLSPFRRLQVESRNYRPPAKATVDGQCTTKSMRETRHESFRLNYQQYQLFHRMLCMTSMIACGRGTKTWLNSFFFNKLYRCSGGNLLLNHHFHKIHHRLRHHPRKTWASNRFFWSQKTGPKSWIFAIFWNSPHRWDSGRTLPWHLGDVDGSTENLDQHSTNDVQPQGVQNPTQTF